MEAVNSLARRLGCTGMLYINVCDMHDAQHVQTEKELNKTRSVVSLQQQPTVIMIDSSPIINSLRRLCFIFNKIETS